MSVTVHATAVVDPSADLGDSVDVGAYAVIGPRVSVGPATIVGPHVIIEQDVRIGAGNRIHAGAAIGGSPQHRDYAGERTYVRIGDRNVIREYATIHRGFGEGTATEIGDDTMIMAGAHVSHNCRIGNGAVIVNAAMLAGFAQIGEQANISGLVGVHQFVRVGRLAMVGPVSMVRQDVPPFILTAGPSARAYGLNVIGLTRAGVAAEHRDALKQAFALLYRRRLALPTALGRMEDELGTDPYVRQLIDFLTAGTHRRGIVPWSREAPSD
ncbi:MAG TPA: acyl-ACP--UDP-N-acetylglucosamine O-acyltransferase [bacterium]|jgi:UDP-N-acetylglucosamine acyltransferase